MIISLNIEELVERLEEFLKCIPWQQIWPYGAGSDTFCLEPEYGLSELLVNCFARQDDKHVMFHTKSDNVEDLLGLDHRGHSIINWTVSCNTLANEFELKAPSLTRRR